MKPSFAAASRRALLAAALACSPPAVERARAAEWSIKAPEDKTVYAFEKAPGLSIRLPCINLQGRTDVSLSDLLTKEGKYVVLWFFPEDSSGLDSRANEVEALNFQKMRKEYDDLDAVVLGCSGQSLAREGELVSRQLLTIPFVSDSKQALSKAFGANNALGETFRQTFILDPSGTVRWIERNIQYNVGNLNVANHAARVQETLYRVRNTDGWAI